MTISIVLLSSIVFALMGFINAVFAKKFDDISIVPTFRADAAYLPRRRVLLDLAVAGVLAEASRWRIRFSTWSTPSATASSVTIRYQHRVAYVMLVGFVIILFTACLYLLNRGIGIRE